MVRVHDSRITAAAVALHCDIFPDIHGPSSAYGGCPSVLFLHVSPSTQLDEQFFVVLSMLPAIEAP